MVRRLAVALFACALLMAGGCARGQVVEEEGGTATASAAESEGLALGSEAAGTEAAQPSAQASSAAPSDTADPATAPAVAAPTQLAGVAVAAPEGYQLVPLPAADAAELERARGEDQRLAGLEAVGIADPDGNEAAVVIVTQYAGIDVTTAEFDAQRRAQAEAQGSSLADEEISGTPVLTSATPPLVSWTQGQDTLIVVSSNGAMTLEQLREVAATMLAAA